MALTTEFNFSEQPDQLYNDLIALHEGLDEAASAALNARLILLLMNQIGDAATIREAFAAAKQAG
jgi:hypothetical protein